MDSIRKFFSCFKTASFPYESYRFTVNTKNLMRRRNDQKWWFLKSWIDLFNVKQNLGLHNRVLKFKLQKFVDVKISSMKWEDFNQCNTWKPRELHELYNQPDRLCRYRVSVVAINASPTMRFHTKTTLSLFFCFMSPSFLFVFSFILDSLSYSKLTPCSLLFLRKRNFWITAFKIRCPKRTFIQMQ